MIKSTGFIYTFYSYKGGVGRSMALANVAALLAKVGRRVLIIDWDLEAPGLEKYFQDTLSIPRAKSSGVLDLVTNYRGGNILSWKDCLLTARPFLEGEDISILTAGKENEEYVSL